MKYKVPEEIVYGCYPSDEYYIVKDKESNELLIVHAYYFGQNSAIAFTVGNKETDWSEEMLLNSAKAVVDYLNDKKYFPDITE